METSDTPKNLFELTQAELGFTDEQNCISLYDDQAEHPMPDTRAYKIFDHDQAGNLTILVYGIDQTVIKYFKKGSGKTSSLNGKELLLRVTRLLDPKVNANGDIDKYRFVPGQPTYPFFPPNLCKKYNSGEKINTLTITEGYKKAFKGDMHGLDVVGLGSISHWRDKETGKLHSDIEKLVTKCQVERIIWLADGDCVTIKTKHLEEMRDLYRRPNQFYSSISTFRDVFSDTKYDHITKYFSHVLSDQIEGNPKGLDDLLVSMKGHEGEVLEALNDFGKKGEKSKYQNNLFIKFDVSVSPISVHRYLGLRDVNDFYQTHIEKRPDLGKREFIFHGTKYRFDEKEGKCIMLVPSQASDYIRVATTYYKKVSRPSSDGSMMKVLEKWDRSTLVEDHSKTILQHIPKYNSFCIVPDHFNYQPVIHNCYNQYFPFDWNELIEKGDSGTEDDFPVTMEFLKHIFGDAEISWHNPITQQQITIREVDLGLAYLKILLMIPTHILPILCLVSRERQTGKTTFLDWLKLLFTNNMIFVGNDDLKNEFNKHWASKLIVACDETKIDKHEVVEKVKRLATTRKTSVNSKGKDQQEQDFFAKFIFLSNNEDNFLPADKEEIRFWVRKVKPIGKLNTDLLKDLQLEIPNFLYYLQNLQYIVPRTERHWFDSNLLKTDALIKLQESSASTAEKEITTGLRDMFEDTGLDEINLTKKLVQEQFLKGKYELNYIEFILEQKLKTPRITDAEGNSISKYFKYPYWRKDGEERILDYAGATGRYYIFKREVFVKHEVKVEAPLLRPSVVPLKDDGVDPFKS